LSQPREPDRNTSKKGGIPKKSARNIAKKRPRNKRDADEARTDRAIRRFGRSNDEGRR
jgi:hypothetical protein